MSQLPHNKVLLDANSIGNFKSYDDFLAGKCQIDDVPYILDENKKYIKQLQEIRKFGEFDVHDEKGRNEYAQFLCNSFGLETADAYADLNAYMEFVINTDVMASPWAMSAFQVVPLKSDTLPLIKFPRSRNHQRFTVKSVALDGGTSRNQWRETRDVLALEMEMIGTETIEYSTRNLQTGDINAGKDLERELKYDLSMKVDSLALANIDAAQVASGLRDSLNIHPSIVVANIPDKNYLNLNGTNPGILTLDKVKQIVTHINRFGSAGDADEKFSISSIQISPQNMEDPWDFVSMVAGWNVSDPNQELPKNTVPDSVREQIYNTGMITSAFGQKLSWVPNPQLAKGKMYVTTTAPLGWMFTKPEYDQFFWYDERTSPQHAQNGTGEMLAKKALKFYVPDAFRQRILIVDL